MPIPREYKLARMKSTSQTGGRVTLDYEFFLLSTGVGEHVTEHEQADPTTVVAVRGEHLLDAVLRSKGNRTSTGSSLQMVFRKEGSQVWN